MKLLLKINLCIILLLCLLNLNGQTNFRPGYVITNSNDTLQGLIDNKGDVKNAKNCEFKESADAKVKEFKPFGIKGFRFKDDKYFVSKKRQSQWRET